MGKKQQKYSRVASNDEDEPLPVRSEDSLLAERLLREEEEMAAMQLAAAKLACRDFGEISARLLCAAPVCERLRVVALQTPR